MEQKQTDYQKARARVQNTPELRPYIDIIIEYDWNDSGHYAWVATAPVSEILAWAEGIRADEQEAEYHTPTWAKSQNWPNEETMAMRRTTLNVHPVTVLALRDLAHELGLDAVQGPTVGTGSVSQLVNEMGALTLWMGAAQVAAALRPMIEAHNAAWQEAQARKHSDS